MRGDSIIPTSKSETASDVSSFVGDVILRPGFHMIIKAKPFPTVAMIEIKMNNDPNIVVTGGFNVDIRVVQFMSTYLLRLQNVLLILIE